jgi:hypothetical protein
VCDGKGVHTFASLLRFGPLTKGTCKSEESSGERPSREGLGDIWGKKGEVMVEEGSIIMGI